MKLIVKAEGGPSPGVTIIGEREDLIALADRLRAGATEKEKGRVGFGDFAVRGNQYEWIEFEVVKSLKPLSDAQKIKQKLSLLTIGLFFVVVVSIIYLACLGVMSLKI